MNMRISIMSLTAIAALQGCSTMSSSGAAAESVVAQAALRNAAGRNVGSAEVVRNGADLYLTANVSGQTAGAHGIHFHTAGKCEAPGFTSAGGHLNPTSHQHGTMNPAGPHMGDLPNITVAADGSGMLRTKISGSPDDLVAGMFDADGTSIVLHAGPDDYKTDPSGNSGDRLACGVLERSAS